jgi:hypothetical protein
MQSYLWAAYEERSFIMGIRGLNIMEFNQYLVECTYNGKIELSFKVTAANPRVAMETARSIIGHRYELRVKL